MLTHYPKWLTIPSFTMIIAAVIGALSEGHWQVAATALATTILLGIVLQSNADLRDDVNVLLERRAEEIAGQRIAEAGGIVVPVVIPPEVAESQARKANESSGLIKTS
jgi:hypothetical protein